MKRWVATLAGVGLSLGLGACGITTGPVETHGRPQANDRIFPNQVGGLKRPDSIGSAVELVTHYLRAAADKPTTVRDTLRSYMVNKSWEPTKRPDGVHEVNVYRIAGIETSGRERDFIPVKVRMQLMGVLRDGRIYPKNDEKERVLPFEVDDRDGLLLRKVSPELMISDETLWKVLERREIYYWDATGTRLVPDVRYVPGYVNAAEKSKLLVDWLLQGIPSVSEWLGPGLRPMPTQMRTAADPVLQPNGTLVVDLQGLPAGNELAYLRRQLENTLISNSTPTALQLRIQGQQDNTTAASYEADSSTYGQYAVMQEKLVRLESSTRRRPVPLPEAVNSRVDWAAFSRGENAVALMRKDGGFLVGPNSDPQPVRVGAVEAAQWLFGDSRAVAVLADHKLFHVTATRVVSEIAIPTAGKITSFSVVPDGRIAFTIEGRLWVGALVRDAETVRLDKLQQVPTAMRAVHHVAISKKSELVIAGLDNATEDLILTAINIDGSLQQSPMERFGTSQQISRLTCDFRTGTAYFNYNNTTARQLLQGRSVDLQPNQVIPPPGQTPSGSPSPGKPPAVTSVSIEE